MQDPLTLSLNTSAVTLFQALDESTPRPACLVLYSGADAGQRFMLQGESLTLGRSPECDILLDHPGISRRHARLHIDGDRVCIADLGSSNGTLVNDKHVDGPFTLCDGDLLRLGNVVLRYYGPHSLDALLHDRIYRLATIDDGTEAFTKRYLLEALERELLLARRTGAALSVLCLDLDQFKSVNDRYGHNNGDVVLREAAAVLQRVVRVTDIVGRMGGEEFVVVLPDTSAARARELAERIRARLAEHAIALQLDDTTGPRTLQHWQTVSIGVAELHTDMACVRALLGAADAQLYAAKRAGRNQICG